MVSNCFQNSTVKIPENIGILSHEIICENNLYLFYSEFFEFFRIRDADVVC